MIEATTKLSLQDQSVSSPRVSGSHKKHYSPNAKVVIDGLVSAGEGLIALSEVPNPDGAIRLASPNNLEEYAGQLYSALRRADELKLETVHVIAPTGAGLALAIRDRITRAADKG
jgi:L-threonylcarbamoyladenylate synthase